MKQDFGQKNGILKKKPPGYIFQYPKIHPAISGPSYYVDKKGGNNKAIECPNDLREE